MQVGVGCAIQLRAANLLGSPNKNQAELRTEQIWQLAS